MILPQRSLPPIRAKVVVDFHVGTQSSEMRTNLHAGAAKVRLSRERHTRAVVRKVAPKSAPICPSNTHCVPPQISIATQCDTKRFRERIPEMVRVWRGPIVVVVLLRSMAEMDDVRAAVAENPLLAQCAPHTCMPKVPAWSTRFSPC